MAYEFKKLSEVETVEEVAETANVLIEEDGVIKKTSKSNVGGVGIDGPGVGGFDFIIIDNLGDAHLEVGSYQNIYDKIMNKKAIFGLVSKYVEYEEDFFETFYFTALKSSYESENDNRIRFTCLSSGYGSYLWFIYPDNTVQSFDVG